jgi:hypothetical protein
VLGGALRQVLGAALLASLNLGDEQGAALGATSPSIVHILRA